MRQLRNGVGFARKTVRTADAFAISCYPSRGLYFIGFEIKISRSDWLKELATPAKAESLQQFCRHWYVAAPKGVLTLDDVPPTWGYIECEGRSSKVAKPAPIIKFKPPDMLMLCAILRNLAETHVPLAVVNQRVKEAENKFKDNHRTELAFAHQQLQQTVAAFEQASGVQVRAGGWGSQGNGRCRQDRQAA